MNEEEKLFPLLQGKTLIINNAEAATRLSELLQPLEDAHNRLPDKPLQGMTISEKMRIADLLILATNPNNTRTNISMIVDDYEEDCPLSKETQDRLQRIDS